jgi:hypothetical protein
MQSHRVIAAFLKRRWFLLSCAVVLVGLSMVNLSPAGGQFRQYGVLAVSDGFIYILLSTDSGGDWGPKTELSSVHAPMPGTGRIHVLLPIWIPLSAVVGWLVISELRRKEKKIARKRHERAAQTAMDSARRKRYLVSNALPI